MNLKIIKISGKKKAFSDMDEEMSPPLRDALNRTTRRTFFSEQKVLAEIYKIILTFRVPFSRATSS